MKQLNERVAPVRGKGGHTYHNTRLTTAARMAAFLFACFVIKVIKSKTLRTLSVSEGIAVAQNCTYFRISVSTYYRDQCIIYQKFRMCVFCL